MRILHGMGFSFITIWQLSSYFISTNDGQLEKIGEKVIV
jgi:hypothetical protein